MPKPEDESKLDVPNGLSHYLCALWAFPLTKTRSVHRDRKATYVKALELEVAKLRAKDVAHDDEIKRYAQAIRNLTDLLTAHGIPTPAGLPQIPINSPLATIEVAGAPNDPTIRAHLPVFDASAPFPFQKDMNQQVAAQPPPAGNLAQPSSNVRNEYGSRPTVDTMNLDVPASVGHPHGLDAAQVGIDFVLALEHICLWHAQFPSPMLGPESGTGHRLMLINPIMACAPPRQQPPKGTDPITTAYSPGTKWSVPANELEKLLSYSESLPLDGEITPVQAWQRVKNHTKFCDLTPSGLEALQASLLTVVDCYG
jgi:hypothetical protein